MSPRLLLACVALAALVACGGDDGSVGAGGSTSTTLLPGATDPAADGAGTPTTTGATDETTVVGSQSATDPGDAGPAGDGDVTATTAAGTASGDEPSLDDAGPPGSFGVALLGSRTGGQIVVQVLAQDGAVPAATTVDHLVAALGAASGKQVTVAGGDLAGGERTWTADDLRSTAASAGREQGGGRVSVQLLFVHGAYEDGDGTLGVTVQGAVAAVFVDRVAASATLGMGTGRLEQAVSTHEVGHLLGLVDLAIDRGRDDPDHPGHSRSTGSVMYWAVESDLVGQVLGAGPPVDFDADDRADLDAIRRLGS